MRCGEIPSEELDSILLWENAKVLESESRMWHTACARCGCGSNDTIRMSTDLPDVVMRLGSIK